MDNYQANLQEELAYLDKTLAVIRQEIEQSETELTDNRTDMIALRKAGKEITRQDLNNQTALYIHSFKRLAKKTGLLSSPYFGRFDFTETGSFPEKIYVGLANLFDSKTRQVYVYDWRSPIAGIFYRYELGPASYEAPMGQVSGTVSLKRQYKIRESRLQYFFDSDIRISDEVLQEVLGRNSSPLLKNIVATIQREQDLIIRDTSHELLLVQGVAGSGKTSVAMHRIAYLLYEGRYTGVDSDRITIISPNDLFSQYIADVLPELGEDSVVQMTFDEIASLLFQDRYTPETRFAQLESVIAARNTAEAKLRKACIEFKESHVFVQILDRLLYHFAHRLLKFEDVYYNGIMLSTRQQLKNRFLNNKISMPLARHLQRIEKMLLDRFHSLHKERLARLEKIVAQKPEHLLEIKPFSRLLAIKEAQAFLTRLQKMTKVDYWGLYQRLFSDRALFYQLTQGLELPEDIEEIINFTEKGLNKGWMMYEDCAPLLYLLLKIDGCDSFLAMKHVLIDEAQDYSPVQYEVFKLLFRNAGFTVLGDVQQALEKNAIPSFCEDIARIFKKPKTLMLNLTNSYRSSYEINVFTQGILAHPLDCIFFERHEKEPEIIEAADPERLNTLVLQAVYRFLGEGFASVAVICKTGRAAAGVFARLLALSKLQDQSGTVLSLRLLEPQDEYCGRGVMVLPTYLAKGLEFDAVIVYEADKENYSCEPDRNLLYIACSRALHRLELYYSGERSPFLHDCITDPVLGNPRLQNDPPEFPPDESIAHRH